MKCYYWWYTFCTMTMTAYRNMRWALTQSFACFSNCSAISCRHFTLVAHFYIIDIQWIALRAIPTKTLLIINNGYFYSLDSCLIAFQAKFSEYVRFLCVYIFYYQTMPLDVNWPRNHHLSVVCFVSQNYVLLMSYY